MKDFKCQNYPQRQCCFNPNVCDNVHHLQGLCQLIESPVTIRCREEDKAIVEGAVQPALSSVKDKIKMHVEIKVDSETFLSPKW